MRDVELLIPPPVAGFLRETILKAGSSEVFFLGKVGWEEDGRRARLEEVDVLARGNRMSVPAILERAEDWDIAIHNHPGGSLEPSAADVDVASELGTRSVGFAIINNAADRCYLVVPPFRPEKRYSVDPDEVRLIFSDDGPLASAFEGYEGRSGQLEMALEVTRSLNEDRIVACEAGTGVGKSFAYLIPSILWAARNRDRVVVSTGTINLQEQLVGKDLPFLENALGVEFHYALIKGRNNFACRRKLSGLSEEFLVAPPSPAERKALEDLVDWAKSTEHGSIQDLAWNPTHEVWEKIMSETDSSLKVNCPFYQDCFYYRSKRRAFKAQILVANHHLFFADLAVRRQTGNYTYDLVLPAYSRVIFDEAHHLEDVSSEHFSARVSRRGVRQRLARMRSRDGQRGRLTVLARKLGYWGDTATAVFLERSYSSKLLEIGQRVDELFEELEQLVQREQQSGARGGPPRPLDGSESPKIRFRPGAETHVFWEAVRSGTSRIRGELDRISAMNDRALPTIDRARIPDESRAGARLELESFRARLESFTAQLDQFADFEDASMARWIDLREGTGSEEHRSIGLAAVPIRVADHLAATLYKPLKSVILTSATLSVEGKPEFLADRLGFSLIEDERFGFHTFDSPFRFHEQVLTVVPRDFPAPGSPPFESELPRLVLEILRASGGRAFVLFTSYSLLRKTHAALEKPLASLGIRALAQGQAQRSELLRRFREGASSVLFGTDSFWEGVDVRGRALECVIITRLPFRVPSEPLYEARLEEIASRGMNPFVHFTVPQAVLRFKQGFGRLIRSARDRGVVAILDPRVLRRPYGRTFLGSLPRTRFASGSALEMVRRVEEFFKDEAKAAEETPAGRQPAECEEPRRPPWDP